MSRAVIAFGSNLGDRDATLAAATPRSPRPGVELAAVSPLLRDAALTAAAPTRRARRI